MPRAKVRETRAALVDHFKCDRFVHPSALFAVDAAEIAGWRGPSSGSSRDMPHEDESDVVPSDGALGSPESIDGDVGSADDELADELADEPWPIAAE